MSVVDEISVLFLSTGTNPRAKTLSRNRTVSLNPVQGFFNVVLEMVGRMPTLYAD